MPATDVLDWIVRNRRAGRLAVRHDALLRTFETDGESVTWVSSNRPTEVLSQVLRARGLIDEVSLEKAATTEVASGTMLGQALVDSGVLSADQVASVLESQIREAAMDILSWNRGSFRFVPDRSDRRGRLTVSVPISDLLSVSSERLANWRRFRTAAPDDSASFWLKDGSGRHFGDSAEIEGRHQSLLELIRAGATLAELTAKSASQRVVTFSDLATLIGRGIIGAVPSRADGTIVPAAIELAASARVSLEALDFKTAVHRAREACIADPRSEELAALLAGAERAMVAELARTLLDSYRIPRRLVADEELGGRELSSDQRYSLARVDGVWDLFSLVSSSAIGEVASLLTYRELDERGLIAL